MTKQTLRCLAVILSVLSSLALAQETPYMKPPQAILDVLNAPEPPQVSVSPTRAGFRTKCRFVGDPPFQHFQAARSVTSSVVDCDGEFERSQPSYRRVFMRVASATDEDEFLSVFICGQFHPRTFHYLPSLIKPPFPVCIVRTLRPEIENRSLR